MTHSIAINRRPILLLLLTSLLLLLLTVPARAARIKDIAQLHGVRPNQLIGYGLVSGLQGTGDDLKKSLFTRQALYNMMVRQGISINPDDFDTIKVKNVAAVMVTANLPPFAKPGATLDIQVSSIGDAKSLAGGTLLLTPLKAPDGHIYAVAQGGLTVGAFAFGGKAAKAQKNHPTVGTIAGGALVERAAPGSISGEQLTYQLRAADFTTASNMSRAINQVFNEELATAIDSSTVTVTIPELMREQPIPFIAALEGLEVTTDSVARVVINERTGTIVMGQGMRLATVAVSHGNLSIVIKDKTEVSQPEPFGQGETVAAPDSEVVTEEEQGELMVVEAGVSIGEVADALNAIGATPRDLIAIFQAIKAAGAMQGELIIL